ncbi:MAG: 50S ribosomal protein L10 [Candidatus Thorarchaeota archaeon]
MATSVAEFSSGLARKQAQITSIRDLISQNANIAIADLSGISSKALQGIRRSLRSGDVTATIKIAKNTLKSLAFEKLARESGNKDLTKLIPYIRGSCALVFFNTNPFKMQKFLDQNRVPAPAKAGQISSVDVYVPEGATNLEPGPIISELGAVGLATRIERGKIKITKTTKVLSVGETVTETLAAVLTRLGIQPFKVGLELGVVLEDGGLIDGAVLKVDKEKVVADLQRAYVDAIALAIHPEVAYYAENTIGLLMRKAVLHALTLSLVTGYVTNKTTIPLLTKSRSQALMLKEAIKKKNPEIEL